MQIDRCFCGISIGVFAAFQSVFLWHFNRCFCGVLIGVFAVPALSFNLINHLRVIELAASRFFWLMTSAYI